VLPCGGAFPDRGRVNDTRELVGKSREGRRAKGSEADLYVTRSELVNLSDCGVRERRKFLSPRPRAKVKLYV